jgi:CheY-like chemotaxis protein
MVLSTNNNQINSNLEGINLLVVDDEQTCLTSVSLLFFGTKCNVIPAQGGNNALEYLHSNPKGVDVILLDLMMPGMNGITTLAEIRKNPLLQNIPVVLQTGVSSAEEISKAKMLGIDGYITKPYKKDSILPIIAQIATTRA